MVRSIAILGFGAEGQSAYSYFTQQPQTHITILDEQPLPNAPQGTPVITGPRAFENLEEFDLIVRSPSVRPDRIHTKGRVTSVINEFLRVSPSKNIIGVTGSKGKGTTSSLIYHMLKAAGKRVHLGGNIGVPALNLLPDIRPEDIVVLELSSFQLWDVESSPHVAVVLMIEPEHQDVHSSVEEYIEAKSNITKHQKADDVVICHPNNELSAKIAAYSPGLKLKFGEAPAAFIKDGYFCIDGQNVVKIDQLKIPGAHNQENALAAITAVWQFTHNTEGIAKAVGAFKGLEYRLEKVREINEVTFINDSFSSAPGAAVVAIRAFDAPEVLICGGFDRGLSFTALAQAIKESGNVKKVLLIGQTKDRIAKELQKNGISEFEVCHDTELEPIIKKAYAAAEPGDIVLFSPGCPSFDMFQNFYERGKKFKQIVGGL